MQTRTCFNGGELSPEMAARCDVDAYMRGCRVLENWEVSQMGGVRRRRGMRGVCAAEAGAHRLVGYRYTYAGAGGRFVVELGVQVVRVLDMEGVQVARFESGVDGVAEFWLGEDVRAMQLNALLVLTSRGMWPLVLRWDGEDVWSLKRMEFKGLPWRYDFERRDRPVVLTVQPGEAGMVYDVGFDGAEVVGELPEGQDWLRASFWLEQAEAFEAGADLRGRVRVVQGLEACAAGDVVAVKGEEVLRYWVCKKEFPADVYVDGLDDPGCYPDNFAESESVYGFEGCRVVSSVKELGRVLPDTKFAVKCGYWEYFTCVRDFAVGDMLPALTQYADYTEFFVRGLAVGEALPCRGKWEFYCSGLWYGCYEVRRCYEGAGVDGEWEVAGVSFSRVSEATNTTLGGDEGDEECWLRLWLTRSKYMTGELADGFPADSCGNRLIVEGYRHDMVLECVPVEGGVKWVCRDKVNVGWMGRKVVYDWSWCAFGERYGYPVCCDTFNGRLVFAGTEAQPQSIWLSRADDLYNFATGDTDDAAIYRTLYTTTQNPICWMVEANNRLLLGTADAEWTIQPPNGGGITPVNIFVGKHGRVGSLGGIMLPVDDKALFVQRGGGRLWAYGYSFEVDGCRSMDLTVFAPHVLAGHGGVVDCTLLEVPDTVAVFALGDGQVALCTYNSLHQVNAWHRWVTDGRVLSVCALPGAGTADALYLLVEREDGVWIECVDEGSGYVDRGGREYVSELVTTALGNPLEEVVAKRPKQPVRVLLGEALDGGQLEVKAEGGAWAVPPRYEEQLEAGWHELLVFNRWDYEHAVGLRVRSGGACILALQG